MNKFDIKNLKDNVAIFIQEINSMKSDVDNLLKVFSSGQESLIVEEKIKVLKNLSALLTLDSSIEEFLEVECLLTEIHTMVFDFDYIIEGEVSDYIKPSVDSLKITSSENIINVLAQGVKDPQGHLMFVDYKLYNSSNILIDEKKQQPIDESCIFSSIESGTYYSEGTFVYTDEDSRQSTFVVRSDNVLVEEEEGGQIITPTIERIDLRVVGDTRASVKAAGIYDPEVRLLKVDYTLLDSSNKEVEVQRNQSVQTEVQFNTELEAGMYVSTGNFYYRDLEGISTFSKTSQTIDIEDDLPSNPSIFVEFLDGSYSGGGIIRIKNNTDSPITDQFQLKFNTAFKIVGDIWGTYSFPTSQPAPHCGLIEEADGFTTIVPNTEWWPEDSTKITPEIAPGASADLVFNLQDLNDEITECYFNGQAVEFSFDMNGSGDGGTPLPPGQESITLEEVDLVIDEAGNRLYVSQISVKEGTTETFTIVEEGNYSIITTTDEFAGVQLNGQKLIVNGTLAGRTALKISDGDRVRNIGICTLNSDGSRPGLPNYLSMGTMRQDIQGDLDFWFDFDGENKNKRQDANYIYLNGGASVPTGGDWDPPTWRFWGNKEGDRVNNYIKSSMKLGTIPTFVWYNIPGGNESFQTNYKNMRDSEYMGHYFDDLQFCLDKIYEEAGDELSMMILEPDTIGYMAQNNQDVNSTVPEVGESADWGYGSIKTETVYESVLDRDKDPHFPNTFKGLVEAVNYIIAKHEANVKYGWKINLWARPAEGWYVNHDGPICQWTDAANGDKASFDRYKEDIYREAVGITEYYKNAGILSEDPHFTPVDKYGLDGAAPGHGPEVNVPNPANSQWFWNGDHHGNYLLFSEAVYDTLDKPVILWQMTAGHINGTTETNPYSDNGKFADLDNTDTHYECSTSPYLFGDTFDPTKAIIGSSQTDQGVFGDRFKHFSENIGNDSKINADMGSKLITWDNHMQEAIDSGIIMIKSGAGVGFCTHNGGSPNNGALPTDDYWWITKSQKYYENKVALNRKLKQKIK